MAKKRGSPQTQRSDGVGRRNELHPRPRGGNCAERSDLRVVTQKAEPTSAPLYLLAITEQNEAASIFYVLAAHLSFCLVINPLHFLFDVPKRLSVPHFGGFEF